MHASLNSLMLISQKAARGAGVAEGAAEDAGSAAVWLALRGFPALEAVYAAVAAVDKGQSIYGDVSVSRNTIDWDPGVGDRSLSAALIGGAAADLFSAVPYNDEPVACLHNVDVPLMQLAYFAGNKDGTGPIRIRYSEETVSMVYSLEDGHLHLIAGEDTPYSSGRYRFEATREPASGRDNATVIGEDRTLYLSGIELDEDVWQKLRAYAELTFVEPTERSRVMGAGAGINDND